MSQQVTQEKYSIATLRERNVSYDHQHWLTQEDVDMANSYVELMERPRSEITGHKRSCPVHARLAGKIPQALRARMIFPRHPEGLTLLVRAGHGLPLPVSYGDSATVWLSCPLYMFLEMTVIFYARKLPAITKKCYLCIKKKELFESMRNIVILNSLEFSYPLPVLMRVFYKALIIK